MREAEEHKRPVISERLGRERLSVLVHEFERWQDPRRREDRGALSLRRLDGCRRQQTGE